MSKIAEGEGKSQRHFPLYPGSHFRLEHGELASHECIAVRGKRKAVLGLELGDVAAAHRLPRTEMSDLVWQVGDSFVYPADQMNVVVGEGAEDVALRADQLPFGF